MSSVLSAEGKKSQNMSSDNNNVNNGEAEGEGTSTLIGLFAPPPTSLNDPNSSDTCDVVGGGITMAPGAAPVKTFNDSFVKTNGGYHRHEDKEEEQETDEELRRNRIFSYADDDHASTVDGPGSVSHFMGLFAPPPPPAPAHPPDARPSSSSSRLPPLAPSSSTSIPRPNSVSARQSTLPRSNRRTTGSSEVTPLLEDEAVSNFDDSFRREDNHSRGDSFSSWLGDYFNPASVTEETPKTAIGGRKIYSSADNSGNINVGGSNGFPPAVQPITATNSVRQASHSRIPSMPAIDESYQLQQLKQQHQHASSYSSLPPKDGHGDGDGTTKLIKDKIKSIVSDWMSPYTYIGSFMFLFYHVVFCLAMGAAIRRPHRLDEPILGVMTKTAALGIITSSVIYLLPLGKELPGKFCYQVL